MFRTESCQQTFDGLSHTCSVQRAVNVEWCKSYIFRVPSFAHGANNRLVEFRAWSEQPVRRLSRMERTTGSSSFAHGANNRLVVFRAWSEQPAPRLSRMERTTGSSSFAHGANNRLVEFRAWSEQPVRRVSRMERTTGSSSFAHGANNHQRAVNVYGVSHTCSVQRAVNV